jgi:hypothetical protein
VNKSLRNAWIGLIGVTATALLIPEQIQALAPLSGTWWWPATALSLGCFSGLGVRWIRRASSRSPMQFVAAVNGTTAMKLFAALGWITAYLVTHESGRLEYVFSTFGVFVAHTVILVTATTSASPQNEKN